MRRTLIVICVAVKVLLGVAAPNASHSSRAPAKKAAQGKLQPSSQSLSISDVKLSSEAFNPSQNEKARLAYRLSRDAKVTIKVFDPDRELTRTLTSKVARKAGDNQEFWNGRDLDGKVVPNESYFFTIEAEDSSGKKALYDPITFSGGEFADITKGQMDRESGTLTYQLSQPSRVLLRAGMSSGLLLKTIVDWEPRSSGTITEYWNGRDEDALFDVPTLKGTTMVLSYMTLPDSSVITIGNAKSSYRDYKSQVKRPHPAKEDRPMTNARKISPHFLKPRMTDRAFKIDLSFPESDTPGSSKSLVPSIKNSGLFRLAIADGDKDVLAGQQFEIMVHMDTAFLLEEERGYLPFTFPLEVKKLPAGDHILTVNIITFGDQIAVASRKIKVAK